MIVYQSTKEGFLDDVLRNEIDTKINQAFFDHLGRHTSPNEVLSWTNSMMHMSNVLMDGEIAADAGISIEFQIPLTSNRIDFIITGLNEHQKEQVIIIELKQWSSAQLTDKDAMVRTRFQHGETETVHPSYQAWSYAALIESYNQTVREEQINLIPCAYLHNYNPDNVITNPFYSYHTSKAPVFLKADAVKLREFIKKFVKYGDNKDILYRIENGRLRPSKQLADSIASMIRGNREFIMIDEQKAVYETALSLAAKARSDKKMVLIVEGGPGTGKSVVAVNLLAELTQRGQVTRYVSKNAAPREVYKVKLTGTLKKRMIDNLFGGSGDYCDIQENTFDTLIVDEAHRLNMKSGLYQNRGENQVKELIRAAKFTVFFIDNDQQIHIKDIGESNLIARWAEKEGAKVQRLKLKSQFRCNGSDGYLAWLENTLQQKETANIKLTSEEFDFRIVDNPSELRDLINQKNEVNNKSRLVAGYCWDWVSKKNPSAYDITFPQYDFGMRWNLTKDGSTWIIAEDSVNEVGCIHTCQGLELDYVGVIIGPDIRFENGRVVTDVTKRSSMDRSISGIKTMLREDPQEALQLAERIIKNTYRTLLTRGMKGCYVYCCDQALRDHFAAQLSPARPQTSAGSVETAHLQNSAGSGDTARPQAPALFREPEVLPGPRIEAEVNASAQFVEFLPLYSVKAACGAFGEGQYAEETGWVKVEGLGRLNRNMFVVQAKGHSMEPKIPDGSLCVFRANVVGSRQNKIVLVQHRGLHDVDYTGSYTIKTYTSEKSFDRETGQWQHERIVLKPINPAYSSIVLDQEDDFTVVGEFIDFLR
ncbi:MAG: DNA/RNA helicase domain-containing protein [Bacteroidales bacterium]